jgi:hypothetical protein
MVPSFISRGTPHQPTREASISEGRNLNEFSQQPVILTAEAGVFYMPQSWDIGQIIWLPLRRKACWGFLHQKNPTASANHQTTAAVERLRDFSCTFSVEVHGSLNRSQHNADKRPLDSYTTAVVLLSAGHHRRSLLAHVSGKAPQQYIAGGTRLKC